MRREEALCTSSSLAVQVRLACTAEVPPKDLFQGIQLSEGEEEEGSRVLMDDLGIAAVRPTDRQTSQLAMVVLMSVGWSGHHCMWCPFFPRVPSATACLFRLNLPLQDSAEGRASIFTGEEEVFAAQRVVSRLTEMHTESYWQKAIHERRRITPSY